MLKIFMVIIALFTIAFASDNTVRERHFFSYGEAATLGGYPMLGGGLRYQQGYHGADLSLDIMPIAPTIYHIKAQHLLYPWQKGLYFGNGLGVFHDPELKSSLQPSYEGSLGYQWNTSRNTKLFIEAGVTFPFNAYPFPGIRFGLGF